MGHRRAATSSTPAPSSPRSADSRSAFSAQLTTGVRPGRRPAAPPSASTSCAFHDDEYDSGCAPTALAMADWMSTKMDWPSPTTSCRRLSRVEQVPEAEEVALRLGLVRVLGQAGDVPLERLGKRGRSSVVEKRLAQKKRRKFCRRLLTSSSQDARRVVSPNNADCYVRVSIGLMRFPPPTSGQLSPASTAA